MVENPLVSIAIPCYNHSRYIQDCIKSVIDQDYENIELIIIDDGSSDNSVEKIHEMIAACEIRFSRFCFRHRSNKGVSATLNEAIEWCKGVYFTAFDSDDVMFPEKTSTQLKYMEAERKDVAGVFSGCYLLDSNGKATGSCLPPKRFYTFDDIVLRKHLIICPTQLLRLDCVRSVGGYPDNLYVEDWYMWLALTENGDKLSVTDGLLVGYRQHDENSSKNAFKMYEGRVAALKFFSKNPLHNKSMAMICLAATIDFTSISKIKGAKFLFDAIGYSKIIVFSPLFINCILRLVIPRFFFLHVKELKRALVGNAKGIVT